MTYLYRDAKEDSFVFVVVAENEIEAAGKLSSHLKRTKLMKVKNLRHFQVMPIADVAVLEGVCRV